MSSATVDINATWMLDAIRQSAPGTIVLKGGTRSGKTYQGLIYWIIRLLEEQNRKLSIVRKYRESHRLAAFRDFEAIMRLMHLWDDAHMHKGEFYYEVGSSVVEFLGMDVEEKKMGAARDYLWVNEATELTQNEYRHLAMRTSGDTLMFDFNPKVDIRHWIPSDIMQRPGTTVISSTYRDNPHLTARQIEEIERIRTQDPLFWKVYGEGDFAALVGNIYPNWSIATRIPDGVPTCYGVDFGFTDPTVIVECGKQGDVLYWQERLYRTSMTGADLVAWITSQRLHGTFYCDGARPEIIADMQRAGIDARPADKRAGSVRARIEWCRRHHIHVIGPMIETEISQYRWREDRGGGIIDGEPVEYMDHAMDAAGYGSYTRWGTPTARVEVATVRQRTGGLEI